MNLRKLAAAATILLTMTAAGAAPAGATCATGTCDPEQYTCAECCRIKCIGLYPGNPAMQNLCTWSCIDQQGCGVG